MRFIFQPGKIFRHIAILSSGSAIAMSINVILLPLITRIYSPESFGLFSVYLAITSVLAVIVGLRYELTIPLVKSKYGAEIALRLTITIVIISMVCIFVLFLPLRSCIANILQIPDLEFWAVFIPFSAALFAISKAFEYWFVKNENFQFISISRIIETLIRNAIVISIGLYLLSNSTGLLVGQMAAQIVCLCIIVYFYSSGRKRNTLARTTVKRLLVHANKYRQFPLYAFPTNFINGLSSSFLPLALAYFYGLEAAGLVFLAQSVVVKPMSVVVQAIWQTIYGRLSSMNYRLKIKEVSNAHIISVGLFIIPVTCIAAFHDLPVLIFGESWEELGSVLPAFAAMMYFNSISNVTSYFTQFQRFKAESVWNFVIIMARLLIIIVGGIYFEKIVGINLYALGSLMLYISINIYWGIILGLLKQFMIYVLLAFVPVFLSALFIQWYFPDLLIRLIVYLLIMVVFYWLFIWVTKVRFDSVVAHA